MGHSAADIILNTIAVLFAIGLNPFFYWIIKADSTRCEVEEFGRLALNDGNKKLLWITKYCYSISIPAVMVAKVALFDRMQESDFSHKWIQAGGQYPYGLELTFYAFLLAPFMETIWLMFVNRKPCEAVWVIVRVAGGWLVLQYLMYWFWQYYFEPNL